MRALAMASLAMALAGSASAETARLPLFRQSLELVAQPEPTGLGLDEFALVPSLREEPTPSSLWLDFRALALHSPTHEELPPWFESITFQPETTRDESTTPAAYRLRFHALREPGNEMQLRLFFDDQKDGAPVVTGWSETGALRFKRELFGDGFGLPTSEALDLPMAGVDYIEVAVVGDPRSVRGVFLAKLKTQELRRALDFTPSPAALDPFGNLPPATLRLDDTKLYGRVKATLDAGSVKLTPRENESCAWEFELKAPPLFAMITFEILNADPLAPLEISLNNRPLGAASLHLPDLADPAFMGLVRPLDRDMRFRYSGWLRCQKAIPGSVLAAGLNKVTLQLNKESGPVAVRALEIQLKHASKTLDYSLSPNPE